MATTLYMTDTLSALSITGVVVRTLSTSRGSGVVTKTQTSVTANTRVFDTGSTPLAFAIRLNAVTLANSAWTVNAWGSESNAMANNGAGTLGGADYVVIYNNDGSVADDTVDQGGGASTEYSGVPAAKTPTYTPLSTAITDGQWLVIFPNHTNVGAGSTAYTVTFSYSGTSAAADGDSYVIVPDTLTEFGGAPPANPPYRGPYPQLLAH